MEFKEYFTKNLKSDFSKKEIEKIQSMLEKSINDFNTENPVENKPNNENKALEKFLETISEKPEIVKDWISEIKKPNWNKSLFKIGIALIIILPITFLSTKGILQTCETATLFGGIVGYLLGDLN